MRLKYHFNSFTFVNRFQKNKDGDLNMKISSFHDGFPALEGFIQRIDAPNYSPSLILDYRPKSGNDGIKLLPLIGDKLTPLNDFKLRK